MDEEELLRFEIEYTPKDVLAATRLNARAKFGVGKVLLLLGIVFVTVLMIMLLNVLHAVISSGVAAMPATPPAPANESFWWDIFPYVVLFFILWVVFFRMIRGKLGEFAKELHPTVVVIAESGVRGETVVSVSDYKWEAFRWFKENDTVFALSLNSRLAVILPKRVMTAEQMEKLRRILQAKIGRVKAFPVEMTGARA